MHFRHISAKIQLQPKNLKQHFDWGGGALGPPWLRLCLQPTLFQERN